MPVSVVCPSCGVRMTAPDELFGRKVKCRSCAAPVAVPDPADADGFDVVDDGRPAPKPARPLPSSDDALRPRKKPTKTEPPSKLPAILFAGGLGLVVITALAVGLFLYLRKPAPAAPAMADVPPPGAPAPEAPAKPKTEWVRFDEQGAPFTIDFPNGVPQAEAAPERGPDDGFRALLQAAGMTPTVRGWSREDGGRKYTAIAAEVPQNPALLDNLNDILKDLPEGKIPPPTTSVIPDRPPLESVTRPAAKRAVVHQTRAVKGVMFELRVEGPADLTMNDEHVRRFFDSFKERVPASPAQKK
jgi:hypothetical protein